MHELSLCQSVYEIVDRAREGRPVITVDLAVGQLRQVVPDTLVHCWTLVTTETPLCGSQLHIDHIPVSLRCRGCGGDTTLDEELSMACRRCGCLDTSVIGGEELMVTAVEVDDDGAVPATAAADPRQEQ